MNFDDILDLTADIVSQILMKLLRERRKVKFSSRENQGEVSASSRDFTCVDSQQGHLNVSVEPSLSLFPIWCPPDSLPFAFQARRR